MSLAKIRNNIKAIFMNDENYNLAVYFTSNAVFTCATALSTNTFIKSFLVSSGLNSEQIGVLDFIESLAMVIGCFLIVGITSRVKNIVKSNALSTLFYVLIPSAIVIITMFQSQLAQFSFLILSIFYGLQNLGLSFKQAISNKSMVNFIYPSKISGAMSVASVTGSLFSILMGTVSSAIMMIVFPTNYTVLFSVAVVLFFLGTFLLSRYKVINVDKTPTVKMAANPVKALIQLFQQRDCRSMLITHLAKGVFTTATTYIIVVALENLKPDAVFSSYIFITSTVATVLGSTIFGFMNKKFKTGIFYLTGGAISAVFMVFASSTESQIFFLVFYFIAMLGEQFVNISLPAGLYLNLDSNVLGSMSGARMLVTFAGKGVTALIVGYLLNTAFPVYLLFAIMGLIHVAGGVLYMITFRNEKIQDNRPSA